MNCAPSELGLLDFSTAALFSEIARREGLMAVHRASGELYAELERQGLLSGRSRALAQLMFRLKREEAKASGLPDARYLAEIWQHRIDQMEVSTT